MLKHLSMWAALITFATGSANAQQQAVLQKIEVPGAGSHIVIAVPKSPTGAIYDLAESPDALVMHLIGGELVVGFDSPEKMIAAAESVRSPVCSFHIESKGGQSPRRPVVVFVTSKDE